MSLDIKDLHFKYSETTEKKEVLDGLTLRIEDNSFTAVAGRTGSGKSTLMKIICGFEKPLSGTVEISCKNGRKPRVGMVFQYPEYQMFEETVMKDVCFGPLNQGADREEAVEKARKALNAVGLNERYYEISPFELSGGEKRLAAIAGVLAIEPDIIILDEPSAGLDPAYDARIMKLLLDLKVKFGKTVIMVTHSMDNAAEFCDHMAVLHEGKCLKYGTTQEVFSDGDVCTVAGIGIPQTMKLLKRINQRAGFKAVREDCITKKECIDEIERALKGVS